MELFSRFLYEKHFSFLLVYCPFYQIEVKKKIYNGGSVSIFPLTLFDYDGEYQITYLEDSLPSGKYILETFNYSNEQTLVVLRFKWLFLKIKKSR